MNEKNKLIELLTKKAKLTAMLAPSFPIVYPYPAIVSTLRQIGFSYVVEVSAGAKITNEETIAVLKNNPKAKFITSPCPSIVRMIKKQFPHLTKYLTLKVDSPMVATAKIALKHYPNHQPVFICPCLVKKLEANEDYPQLNILVVTYKEFDEVLKHFNLKIEEKGTDRFDISEPTISRIYPTDGGLAHSSGIKNAFSKDEIQIVSGWKNCLTAIKDFETNPKIKLLDILFCDGGCINGPGIVSNLPLDQRRKKVFDFWLEDTPSKS